MLSPPHIHNLAGFDSRFILSALGNKSELKCKIMGREMNEIFYVKITRQVEGKHISVILMDSMYFLTSSLEKLGDSFKVETKKGNFPYSFMNKTRLNYIGELPEYFYYKDKISYAKYQEMSKGYNELKKWSARDETLNYLEKDLECLYQVMSKFNRFIFDEWNINVTDTYSYSSLSWKVYLSNYYRENEFKLPIIQGYVENEIRKAYFGGVVDVVENIIVKGWKYDINSHYPAAMKNPIPVGSPVISDIKDLNKIFGFCHAKITAPSVEELRVAILPVRVENGDITCPRGSFEGTWFSEELKNAIKYGYKVEVVSSYLFRKGYNVFDKFVDGLYEHRYKAIEQGNHEQALIYKLILNSLYGKTGQKKIVNNFKFIDKNKLGKINLIYETDLTQHFGNMCLIRTQSKLDPEILKLIEGKKGKELITNDNRKVPGRSVRGVKSSVGIAAAISAYARININKFKNLPNNPYLGGDTDSAIFKYPLDQKFIGKGLGMMKLEGEVVRGIFADKKLYYMIDGEGNTIIKSRGIGLKSDGTDILNYGDFVQMASGHEVFKDKTIFQIEGGDVYIDERKIKVRIQKPMLIQLEKQVKDILKGQLEKGRDPALNEEKIRIAKEIASLYNKSEQEIKEKITVYNKCEKVRNIFEKCRVIQDELDRIEISLGEIANNFYNKGLRLEKSLSQGELILKNNLRTKPMLINDLFNKSKGIRQFSSICKIPGKTGVILDIQKGFNKSELKHHKNRLKVLYLHREILSSNFTLRTKSLSSFGFTLYLQTRISVSAYTKKQFIRYFSNISIHKPDKLLNYSFNKSNKIYVYLPCIDLDDYLEVKDERWDTFIISLDKILNNLNQNTASEYYKLEFYLYVYSNEFSKKIFYIEDIHNYKSKTKLSNNDGLLDTSEILKEFYTLYGYFKVVEENIQFKYLKNYNLLSKSIYEKLNSFAQNTNKNTEIGDYCELHKQVLLCVTNTRNKHNEFNFNKLSEWTEKSIYKNISVNLEKKNIKLGIAKFDQIIIELNIKILIDYLKGDQNCKLSFYTYSNIVQIFGKKFKDQGCYKVNLLDIELENILITLDEPKHKSLTKKIMQNYFDKETMINENHKIKNKLVSDGVTYFESFLSEVYLDIIKL